MNVIWLFMFLVSGATTHEHYENANLHVPLVRVYNLHGNRNNKSAMQQYIAQLLQVAATGRLYLPLFEKQ